MRFQIVFVHHEDSVFVAEVVQPGIVRVVARADGVDVVPLHNGEVFAVALVRQRPARVGIVVVPVHAANLEWLVV
ncbi:hypothetical protein SDC9_167840 [bioreactor metagenome]|uniref:Uncharacterized protein n=1 Tax=bioreactor metagenome TaxID=1076179 RepID=A0A645G0W7_9ZZZZ